MGDFIFLLRLLLSQFAEVNIGLSTYFSLQVQLQVSLSEKPKGLFPLRLRVAVRCV